VKIELEDLWLFSNELSIHVSSIGTEKTSMLNNKMLGKNRNNIHQEQ